MTRKQRLRQRCWLAFFVASFVTSLLFITQNAHADRVTLIINVVWTVVAAMGFYFWMWIIPARWQESAELDRQEQWLVEQLEEKRRELVQIRKSRHVFKVRNQVDDQIDQAIDQIDRDLGALHPEHGPNDDQIDL